MAKFKENIGKIYVGSDWHADYSIYMQAKKLMKPEDRLYYLGDSLDRGPCPIKLFLALARDPQVTFIMGNHEEMAYNVLIKENYDSADKDFWFSNGGITTYNQFYNIENNEILKELTFFLKKIYNDSYLKTIKVNDQTFFLSHAGFNFGEDNPILLVWDRMHLFEKNNPPKDSWIIHGHTPVQNIPWNNYKKDLGPEIYNYSSNKISIDLAIYRSKKAALLCLNDLNPVYIKTIDNLNTDPENYLDICI